MQECQFLGEITKELIRLKNKDIAREIRDMLVTRGFFRFPSSDTSSIIKQADSAILKILDTYYKEETGK